RTLPLLLFFLLFSRPPISTLFPSTTLFRSKDFWRMLSQACGCVRILLAQGVLLASGASGESPLVRVSRPGESRPGPDRSGRIRRSEEHTSELQSRFDLVCRLLLEKKNTIQH